MTYIDFTELKTRISIMEVADLLGLELKKDGAGYRAECPKCQGGKRTLVISPDKQAFFCFSTNQGGDLISLVQHVRDISIKEAAHYIHASLTVPPKGATPASNQEVPDHPFSKIAKGLQYDHELLAILGLDKEQAEALGIGFKRAGVMRGKVVIPLRDQNGTVVRCLGLPTDVFAEAELGKEFDLTKV